MVVLLILQFCSSVSALTTTEYEAEIVVRGWLKLNSKPLGASLGQEVVSIETFTNEYGEPVYYIVYLEPSGFVIVSADDLVEPIIGFSEGIFNPSQNSPLEILVAKDLNRRIDAVRNTFNLFALSSQTVFTDTQMKWNYLMSLGELSEDEFGLMAVEPETVSDVRVEPLIKAVWGQMDACGFDCYNMYTPNNYTCGCVATSLAQLMRLHQYPTEPDDYDPGEADGRKRFWVEVDEEREEDPRFLRGGDGNGGAYKWEDMPNAPSCNTRLNQREAIGAICYDAGIASGMSYTKDGSGTTLEKARHALLDVFKYSNAIEGGFNAHDAKNIGSEDLERMINPNLDAGNPVIFGIFDDQDLLVAHAILCDGYGYNASTIYHHLNFGWDDMPTEYRQMWFLLPDISYGASYDYDIINSCVYNIFTTETGEIISGRVVDMQGEAVGDAVVTAHKANGTIYTTMTNSNGIYGLKGLDSNTTYTIKVEKTVYNFRPAEVSTGRSENGSTVCGNVWGVDFEHYVDNEVITIGTGTSSWNYPMHTGIQDSRTQVIYLASEIGRSGNIRDLWLDVTKIPSQILENWTIRIKHTSKNQYSNCALETDGWTVVYRNNELISDTGWRKFEFHTLFEYNGVDSLMVDFSHNSSYSTFDGLCRVSSTEGRRSAYAESESMHKNPLDWPAGNSPAVSCSNKVPNVKLTLTNESAVICGDVKLTAEDGAPGDHFGQSVSICNDYMIVGAYGNSSAYIFKRDGLNWLQQTKLFDLHREEKDHFGFSVSMSGENIIVGTKQSRRGSYAYIYERKGVSWFEQENVTASDHHDSGVYYFGPQVSIHGDYAIVGSITDRDQGKNSGSASIFKNDGSNWTRQVRLIASDSSAGTFFGSSVSINGDYAIVGAVNSYNWDQPAEGSVYVFERNGTIWTEQTKLTVGGSIYDSFGRSIAICGDYVMVGAPDDDGNENDSGSIYIFKRNGASWIQQDKLTASDGSTGDAFGRTISTNNDYIIVGAPYDDDDLNGRDSGSIYVFKRVGTNWIQETKLTAWDGAPQDHFGSSVSIDGYYIIVGAEGDDDMGSDCGSVYIFKRGCSYWPQ